MQNRAAISNGEPTTPLKWQSRTEMAEHKCIKLDVAFYTPPSLSCRLLAYVGQRAKCKCHELNPDPCSCGGNNQKKRRGGLLLRARSRFAPSCLCVQLLTYHDMSAACRRARAKHWMVACNYAQSSSQLCTPGALQLRYRKYISLLLTNSDMSSFSC